VGWEVLKLLGAVAGVGGVARLFHCSAQRRLLPMRIEGTPSPTSDGWLQRVLLRCAALRFGHG
jgi:hypothetical protein